MCTSTVTPWNPPSQSCSIGDRSECTASSSISPMTGDRAIALLFSQRWQLNKVRQAVTAPNPLNDRLQFILTNPRYCACNPDLLLFRFLFSPFLTFSPVWCLSSTWTGVFALIAAGWTRKVTLSRLVRKAGYKRTVDTAFLAGVQV